MNLLKFSKYKKHFYLLHFVIFIYYIFTLKTYYFVIVYLYISFLAFILHFYAWIWFFCVMDKYPYFADKIYISTTKPLVFVHFFILVQQTSLHNGEGETVSYSYHFLAFCKRIGRQNVIYFILIYLGWFRSKWSWSFWSNSIFDEISQDLVISH